MVSYFPRILQPLCSLGTRPFAWGGGIKGLGTCLHSSCPHGMIMCGNGSETSLCADSLVSRPSTPPVFDRSQYAKTAYCDHSKTGGVEGLGMRLCAGAKQLLPVVHNPLRIHPSLVPTPVAWE